jgi:hypothetical protein
LAVKANGTVLFMLFCTDFDLAYHLPGKEALPLMLPIVLFLKVANAESAIDRAMQVVGTIQSSCWILKNKVAKSMRRWSQPDHISRYYDRLIWQNLNLYLAYISTLDDLLSLKSLLNSSPSFDNAVLRL